MPLALIRRLVKGSPLTATEHDTNLNVLEAGIAASLQPGQAIPSDVECRNNSGVGLTAGAPVFITSSSGTKPTVALADASSESTAARSLGLIVATVTNNADCVVRTHGILTGVNTAALTEGLAVWLSETTGQLTSTRPTQPAHGVFFGFCVKQAAGTAGILYINVINGLELGELHDVLLTGAATDDVLALASDGLWKKRTLGSAAAAAITDFAPAAQGVTNGNSHNHDGGDGAQIDYSSLSGLPTLGGAAALNVGTTAGTVAAGDAPAAAIIALKAEANPLPQYLQPSEVVAGTNMSVDTTTTPGSVILNATGGSGTKTLVPFIAREGHPPATNFATIDERNSIRVLEFDAATEESVAFMGIIPEGANLTSGLLVRIWWMADTATSGNVRWAASFERSGTDLDADSFDTATEVTSTANGTSGVETIAAITCTAIDGLAAGDRFRLRIARKAADAVNDTMTGDAQLVAVEVRGVA